MKNIVFRHYSVILLLGLLAISPWALGEEGRMVFPPTGDAESEAGSPDPRVAIERFFQLLAVDNVEAAYTGLVRGSIIEERKEDVETLKDRTQRALDAYGMVRSYEVLEQRTAGTSLVRFTCLSLNEELPLRWRFYFYNSAKGWKLVDLRVDDGLVELFEEVGKVSER